MLTTKSVNGVTIRLPDERWLHIVEGHPEMAGHLNDVIFAVSAPDIVVQGSLGEVLAVASQFDGKWLVVVYKEDEADGFIITAYFTSKLEKLTRRKVLWQK